MTKATHTLIFSNPGEIDIRGACIAGLSAKADDSAIGFFGTGLKYSIACILRWGGEVTIYSGISKYSFDVEDIDFRGREFKQIRMNGTPLGFTTEYGKTWEHWQVFRELYANARDEGGNVSLSPESGHCPQSGATHILVTGVPELAACYAERDTIILPSTQHWSESAGAVQMNRAPANFLYYKGVRVKGQKTRRMWNVLSGLTLTEDRSLKDTFYFHTKIRNFLSNHTSDEKLIEEMLRIKYQSAGMGFEADVMSWWSPSPRTCSTSVSSVAAKLYAQDPQTFKELREVAIAHDESLTSIGTVELTRRMTTMLDRAKNLVSKFGFAKEVSTHEIVVRDLGPNVLGMYELGKITLSPKLFDQGTKQLVATLYEECFHARTAADDCTYNMQNQLFDIIITLNEELHGEIC